MFKIKKNKPGTTLIELLLYCAMISVFIMSITVFSWDILFGKIKNDSQAEVTDNAEIAINQISGIIRNAKSIETPAVAGSPSPTLVSVMPDGSKNTFDFVDGRLRITNSTSTRVNLDVVLVIDVSGSMNGAPLTAEKTAANSFIDQMDSNLDRIGIVSFSFWATLRRSLTSDFASAKSTVNGLDAGGITNYQDAIQKTTGELTGINHRSDASQVMVFMSDGVPNTCNGWGCNPTLTAKAAADAAKANGITIYTIGLIQGLAPVNVATARSILQYIASSNPGTNDHYFEAPTAADLTGIYNQIAYLMTATSAQNLTSSIVASKLTSLSFTNVGITGTPGCVRIQMLISRNNPGGRTEYQTDILIDNSVTLKSN